MPAVSLFLLSLSSRRHMFKSLQYHSARISKLQLFLFSKFWILYQIEVCISQPSLSMLGFCLFSRHDLNRLKKNAGRNTVKTNWVFLQFNFAPQRCIVTCYEIRGFKNFRVNDLSFCWTSFQIGIQPVYLWHTLRPQLSWSFPYVVACQKILLKLWYDYIYRTKFFSKGTIFSLDT